MKKKTLAVIVILLSTVLIAFCASQFWLKPSIEAQIRASLDECNSPDAPFTITYDKNSLAFDVASRTLHLESVTVSGPHSDMAGKISFDSLRLQMPASIFFFDAENIPVTGDFLLADYISLKNFSVQLPETSLTIEQQDIDGLRCNSSLLRTLAESKPLPDFFTLLAQIGVERYESQNILLSAKESTLRVAVAKQHLDNWHGGKIGNIILNNVDLAAQPSVSGQLARLALEQVHLAELASAYHHLTTGNNIVQAPEQTIAALLSQLGNEGPYIERSLIEHMRVSTTEGSIELNKGEILWPNVNPQNFTLALNDFSLPKNTLWAVLHEEAPTTLNCQELEPLFYGLDALKGNFSLAVKADTHSRKVLRESLVCDIPDWGSLRYVHTGDYANPLSGANFSDIALEYTDNSLLARTGLIFFPNGDAERHALALLDNVSSHGNAQLVQQLKNFVTHPGTLRVTSLPGKQLGEASLFLILASPADYLAIEATPAATTLTEQGAHLKKFQ